MFIHPHDPDYVPEPMYPEYIPLEDEHLVAPPSPDYIPGPEDPQTPPVSQDKDEQDEHVLPTEEQPLPPVDSPTAESLGYASISLPPEVEVERLLAMPTPPLTSLSLPSARERLAWCTAPSAHSSPPPVPSPSLPSSGCPTQIQALRIVSTQALFDAVTAVLPSPPLPPPLYIPPPVDRRGDIFENELPHCKKSCLFALGPRYEVGESFTARPTGGQGIDYGFVSTLDAEAR
nr:hypothetical protein [Tanacetum cinerariifolium]